HRGQRSILFSAGMSEIAPPYLPCRAGIGHLSCDGAARSGGLLDGADGAGEDLFKDRHRRCEIEPDELRAVRIKGFAGAKADARMIEEELEGGWGLLDAAAVKPGQIGRLRRMDVHRRRLRGEHLAD